MNKMSKLTPDLIARKNNYASWEYKEIAKSVDAYRNDKFRSRRLSINECKTCYYLEENLAFQACSEYSCGNCGDKQMHHNSNTPSYCKKCCEEHGVCRRCGANV